MDNGLGHGVGGAMVQGDDCGNRPQEATRSRYSVERVDGLDYQ